MVCFLASGLICRSFKKPWESILIIKMTGVRTFIRKLTTPEYANASFSECMVAIVFGVISPKIRIKTVKIPVDIPAATLPKMRMASAVEIAEADKFTILFPIKIALNILDE